MCKNSISSLSVGRKGDVIPGNHLAGVTVSVVPTCELIPTFWYIDGTQFEARIKEVMDLSSSRKGRFRSDDRKKFSESGDALAQAELGGGVTIPGGVWEPWRCGTEGHG